MLTMADASKRPVEIGKSTLTQKIMHWWCDQIMESGTRKNKKLYVIDIKIEI